MLVEQLRFLHGETLRLNDGDGVQSDTNLDDE